MFEVKTTTKGTPKEFKCFLIPEKYFSLISPFDDVNVVLSDGRALQIQECDDGYDWTIFNQKMQVIDGGQYSDYDSSFELYNELAKEFGFEDALVFHIDDHLCEDDEFPKVPKMSKKWKIWFKTFDEAGEQKGAGVMPTEYAHKSSAVRRMKKLSGAGRTYIVSQENPF